jgi:hypothetical protein
VIELVRVAELGVACSLEVHHARVEVSHTADCDGRRSHATVTGMPGMAGQLIASGKPD